MTAFRDDDHRAAFDAILRRMGRADDYHVAAAYLLALLDPLHTEDVFDFFSDAIRPGALCAPWQTGTSTRTTRLLFNLWNGYTEEGAEYLSTPENLFCCELAPFYWEAIKLRFPRYAE